MFPASFWLSGGQIFGRKWGFRDFLKKLLAQFISYLAFILTGWVSLKNSYLCTTRLQNRNLCWIFLDEVGSAQSGGILSSFMGTACFKWRMQRGLILRLAWFLHHLFPRYFSFKDGQVIQVSFYPKGPLFFTASPPAGILTFLRFLFADLKLGIYSLITSFTFSQPEVRKLLCFYLIKCH